MAFTKNKNLFSPAHAEILYHCRPSYWFSAHLHVKFVGLVDHDKLNEIDDQDEDERLNKNRYTRFLGMCDLILQTIAAFTHC